MYRRFFLATASLAGAFVITATSALFAQQLPFQATGFKVGEVSSSSAIIWTRLTLRPDRNPADGPMVEIRYANDSGGRRQRAVQEVVYPPNVTVADIRNAAPGGNGQVRVGYRPHGTERWKLTSWQTVDPARDFTHQFQLNRLTPNTSYDVVVQSRLDNSRRPGASRHGNFRTAPRSRTPSPVLFTVSTGQMYNDLDHPDGFLIYPSMLKLRPSFFVHTGDIVYYDRLAKTEALARYHWQRTYSLPTNMIFHQHTSSYFIKDDHDSWVNDCWPTMQTKYMHKLTFTRGLEIFREQVPMGRSTYRTRRWGQDLQIWMVEGRDFRSANTDPDSADKTIWGEQQKEWFKRTVQQSDASFKILISPTPLVGPDRDNKNDNHSNKGFTHEGNELRDFIASQEKMVVICGDRHWQYMSVDPRTGIREYSCGPASDQHAGGWQQSDYREDYHKYLNVTGGFLSVMVQRLKGTPTLTFQYHNVDGSVNFTDQLTR